MRIYIYISTRVRQYLYLCTLTQNWDEMETKISGRARPVPPVTLTRNAVMAVFRWTSGISGRLRTERTRAGARASRKRNASVHATDSRNERAEVRETNN